MPIQFRCPGCSQPIEVDDPFAGKSAQCPYCRRVITVPQLSELDSATPIEARPSSAVVPPPLPASGTHASYSTPAAFKQPDEYAPANRPPRSPRALSARRFGNAALICAAIAILLLVAQVVFAFSAIAGELARSGTSQPTQQQMQAMMQKAAMEQPMLALFGVGSMTLAIGALLLGAVSWKQNPEGNWRAWISVAIGGLFMLCICGSAALTFAAGASGL